jgi:hypothetical protein
MRPIRKSLYEAPDKVSLSNGCSKDFASFLLFGSIITTVIARATPFCLFLSEFVR